LFKFWVVFAFVYGAASVGGMVVVTHMIKHYGICSTMS
jgi:hypothetical protein